MFTLAVFELDITGAVLGFLATIYYIRSHYLAWPLSIAAMLINIVLYLKQGIYGACSLQIIYLTMTAYGWHQWLHGGKNGTMLPITSISIKFAKILGGGIIVGIAIVVLILKFYTDSTIPYLDATATVLSIVAQLLICRRIIQCWYLWFLVDGVCVAIYLHKGIVAHATLKCFYLAMAVIGYLNWKRLLLSSRAVNENIGIL